MRRAPLVVALAAVALAALDAAARPGGGHTYSGGGNHYGGGGGGGGGGGDGGLIFFFVRILFELCIDAPAIGIPIVLALVVGVAVVAARNRSTYDWDGPSEHAVLASRTGRPRLGSDLAVIVSTDPGFSPVLFEDFAYALFAAAHRARHDPKKLSELAPYLGESVRSSLASRTPAGTPVETVVVGSMRTVAVELGGETRVTLEFEANLILGGAGATTSYVLERWILQRGANVQSRPWSEARTFGCPNCGAPFESTDSQRCKYCGEVVSNGRFDWSVSSAVLLEWSERPPSLRGTVAERGTDLPTIRDRDFASAWDKLQSDDPSMTLEGCSARVELIHREVNRAWNQQNLATVRGFVSDGLYDYLGYWIQAYRAQGLHNVVDGVRIVRWEPVKVRRDAHFDALTARIFATGKDYTLDARGAVVGGSRDRDRAYSEYWTFIRGAGTRGPPRADRACPNCGAELQVEMSGECAYCHVRVTTGRFDWVLSKIEQDDSYAG